jgi:hypothetical protein
MELSSTKIEKLISAAERIVNARSEEMESILFDQKESSDTLSELHKLLEPDILQNPEKSYDLFYNGIQNLILSVIPSGNEIRSVILELKSILLTGKEKKFVTYGKRGADSRMSEMRKMESVIDILTEWSESPHDFFKLAVLLLNKNKELNYVPENREVADYLKSNKN